MTITLYLKTICPVHIGCDEDYEPTGFVIDESRSELVSFDPMDFIKSLDEAQRKRFSDICEKGTVESRMEIMKFMSAKKMNGYRVKVSNGFISHYKDKLKIPLGDKTKIRNELNNFTIARTIFNPNTNQPYIPGSSIKGALRTAWLNKIQKKKNVRPDRNMKADQLEKQLLDGGAFATDPFRMVKVSDFMPVGIVRTRIVYAINRKKNPGKVSNENLSPILEIIEPGSYFKGTITVDDALQGSGINNPVKIQSLFNSATSFYSKELGRENSSLSKIGASQCVLKEIPEGGFLICLGRHSGAEAVTIEGLRNIKIKGPKNAPPLFLPSATTIWLASTDPKPATNSSLTPFGWVTFQRNEPLADEISAINDSYEETAVTATPIKPAYEPVPTTSLTWEKAILSWSPGDQRLTAASEGKKAACTGKDLIPESLFEKVVNKRKPTQAKVEVEQEGNQFRIVKIFEV
ncbi:MAG TPA: type III-A CRISPR-associated RAMP protein Csm5 [Desulfomonilia bacterium]